eukprot:CFRG2930T1
MDVLPPSRPSFSDLNPDAPSFQISPEERRRSRYSVDCVDFSVLNSAGAEGFLKYLRLKKYIPLLEEKGIGFLQLLSMNEKDLFDLGITANGPRVRLQKAIARYHTFQSQKWMSEGSGIEGDMNGNIIINNIEAAPLELAHSKRNKNMLSIGSVTENVESMRRRESAPPSIGLFVRPTSWEVRRDSGRPVKYGGSLFMSSAWDDELNRSSVSILVSRVGSPLMGTDSFDSGSSSGLSEEEDVMEENEDLTHGEGVYALPAQIVENIIDHLEQGE